MVDETSVEVVEVVPEPERLKDGYAWVYHAGLDRTIQVPDTAVATMRGSGWDYAPNKEAEADQPAQEVEPVADAAGSPVEVEEPARRRRGGAGAGK